MRIDFKKVGYTKKHYSIHKNQLVLEGDLIRKNQELIDFNGTLKGKEEVECYRCGTPFFVTVDEKISLIFSEGIYKGFDENADVIEFYDGSIDLDSVIEAESESIKLDYYLCNKCKQNEGE